jgi:hypothetical protein
MLLAAAAGHTVVPAAKPVARPVTACLAVTRGDVESALGRRVGKGEEESSAGTSSCDYVSPRGRVTIIVQRLAGQVDVGAESAALEREIEGSKARIATGFGEAAFFLDILGGGTQLHVIRGRDYLLVSVLGFGEAEQVWDAVERLARTALTRF